MLQHAPDELLQLELLVLVLVADVEHLGHDGGQVDLSAQDNDPWIMIMIMDNDPLVWEEKKTAKDHKSRRLSRMSARKPGS